MLLFQTEYIDLLYIHCWDYGTPIEETLTALTDLVRLQIASVSINTFFKKANLWQTPSQVRSGKVRYIGGSNFCGWQVQKSSDVSRSRLLERFCCMQNQYSLLTRDNEWEVDEVCRLEGVAMLPWSPLKGTV